MFMNTLLLLQTSKMWYVLLFTNCLFTFSFQYWQEAQIHINTGQWDSELVAKDDWKIPKFAIYKELLKTGASKLKKAEKRQKNRREKTSAAESVFLNSLQGAPVVNPNQPTPDSQPSTVSPSTPAVQLQHPDIPSENASNWHAIILRAFSWTDRQPMSFAVPYDLMVVYDWQYLLSLNVSQFAENGLIWLFSSSMHDWKRVAEDAKAGGSFTLADQVCLFVNGILFC